MIKYTVLTDRLMAALAPFGFCHVDGVPASNDDAACQAIIDAYTLADYKAEKSQEVSAHAKTLRDRVTGAVSAGEMASWPIKIDEARQYMKIGALAETPLLTAEAQRRGVSLGALVQKVVAKGVTFRAVEAYIAGVEGKHTDAIAVLQSFDAVAAYDFSAGWPEV